MKKIKSECEKMFPKFLDVGYNMKQASYFPNSNFAIFTCGQAMMGRVNLDDLSIKSVFIKDLGDTHLKNFQIDLPNQKIYAFGKCTSKRSTSLYALFEVDNPGFAIARRHDLDEPIHQFFLDEAAEKLFVLLNSSISSFQIDKTQGLQASEEVFKGNFKCFDFAEGEWLVSEDNGAVKTFTEDFQKVAQVDLNCVVHRVKYCKGKKNVLVLTESRLIKFSNNFHKKVIFELNSHPTDVCLDQSNGHFYVSTQNGKIIIISPHDDQKLFIPVHNYSIVHFWIDHSNEKIITFAEDSKIGIVGFPQLIETYRIRKQASNLISCGSFNDLVYIDSNKSLIKWDLQRNQFEKLYETETLFSKCLKYYRPKSLILFSDENWIYFMNYESKEIVKKIKLGAKVDINHAIFSDDGDTIYTVVSQNSSIFCTNLNSQEYPKVLNGHDGRITCLSFIKTPTEKILFSGSNDCKIFLWDVAEKYEKIGILEGHKSGVTCLALAKNDTILSGSNDLTIKVWDWRNRVLKVSMTGHSSPIIKIRVDQFNYIHSVSSDGMIICWNPMAFVKVFKFTLRTQILDMVLVQDGQLAAVIDINSIKLMQLQVSKNSFDVIGFESELKYEYIYYLSKILKGELVEYEAKWDDWAVLPYQFNTLQFFCYANLHKHIKLSLNNGAFLVPSPTSEPFTIVTFKRLNRSIKSIFKATRTLLDRNPNALCFIGHSVIIELNRLGHSHLSTFYDEIFCLHFNEDFPKFLNKEKLPRVFCSKSICPIAKDFFPETVAEEEIEGKMNQAETGHMDEVPISLYVSAIGLYLDNGSDESIKLIMSLLQCNNKEIFKTKFIQTLLDMKWDQLKVYQVIKATFYLSYLISLSIYLTTFYQKNTSESKISHQEDEIIAFIVVLSIASLNSFYDFWKMSTNFMFFWTDIWNYLDLARILSLIIYSCCFFSDWAEDFQDEMLIIIAFLSLARGISYLRIFNDTRYLIQLIQNVITDIKSFSIILAYSTFSFSIIQVVQEGNHQGYLSHLKEAFMVNLGQLSIDDSKSGLTWIILALMGILNLLILLNMLISIMGDTFSRTKENSEIANYQEIAQMVLETETVSLNKTLKPEKTFLQLCEADTSVDLEIDMVKNIKRIKGYFKEISQKINSLK
jgi:WD40 repeat protein